MSAADTLASLRQTFFSNKTLPLEWRSAQLLALDRLLAENEPRCV